MMSNYDRVVPFIWAPGASTAPKLSPTKSAPGLSPEGIQNLEPLYPGTLTDEMRALLQRTCGLSANELGAIDFTGRWHPEEHLSVFRPSLTLAVDDEGRRWVAETSRRQGLPGPIWCILTEPAVALHVSDRLDGFLDILAHSMRRRGVSTWLRALQREARMVWSCRQCLARESYAVCQKDRAVHGWLAGLPFDAQVYDLRVPSAVPGWPYGLAGPDGLLYRCGSLPIFAVAATPWVGGWKERGAHNVADSVVYRPEDLLAA